MTQRHEPGAPAGLGTFVEGEGSARRFGHGGRNEGFASEVVFFPERGQGAAVMVSGDAGFTLVPALLYAIGAEYEWPDFGPPEIAFREARPETIQAAVGTYATDTPTRIDLTLTPNGQRCSRKASSTVSVPKPSNTSRTSFSRPKNTSGFRSTNRMRAASFKSSNSPAFS